MRRDRVEHKCRRARLRRAAPRFRPRARTAAGRARGRGVGGGETSRAVDPRRDCPGCRSGAVRDGRALGMRRLRRGSSWSGKARWSSTGVARPARAHQYRRSAGSRLSRLPRTDPAAALPLRQLPHDRPLAGPAAGRLPAGDGLGTRWRPRRYRDRQWIASLYTEDGQTDLGARPRRVPGTPPPRALSRAAATSAAGTTR